MEPKNEYEKKLQNIIKESLGSNCVLGPYHYFVATEEMDLNLAYLIIREFMGKEADINRNHQKYIKPLLGIEMMLEAYKENYEKAAELKKSLLFETELKR